MKKMDKYSPDYESFRKLHSIVLDTFKVFKKICDDNGLRYYAISGTTLGVALWKGFIPWDDDMDIAMPASDFLKFKKLCSKKGFLPKDYSFVEYLWFGGKLHNNKTMCTGVQYINKPELYTGVFIDIVPLIGLPADASSRANFIDDLKSFQELALISDRFGNTRIPYTEKQLENLQLDIITKYPLDTAEFVIDFSDPRYILKSSGFQNPLLMPFEDIIIPTSSNYEEDLKIQYRNYSKYPPKNQRVNQNQLLFIMDLDKSVSFFRKEYKKLPKWAIESMEKWQDCAASYYSCFLQTSKELKVLADTAVSKRAHINDIKTIYSSNSYKLGHFILHPIDHLFRKRK